MGGGGGGGGGRGGGEFRFKTYLARAWGYAFFTNLVYGLSLIFVLSSPLDMLIEWQGVRKKLPQVVANEGAPE